MTSYDQESLSHIDGEAPRFIAWLRSWEAELNALTIQGFKEPLYPLDWTLTNFSNQFLFLSRSVKGRRAKQIADICQEGVKQRPSRRSLLGGILSDDEDDYTPPKD